MITGFSKKYFITILSFSALMNSCLGRRYEVDQITIKDIYFIMEAEENGGFDYKREYVTVQDKCQRMMLHVASGNGNIRAVVFFLNNDLPVNA